MNRMRLDLPTLSLLALWCGFAAFGAARAADLGPGFKVQSIPVDGGTVMH